jgi:hypothetical protein
MPFDRQPVLSGDLIALRPLRAEDYTALYAVAADPLEARLPPCGSGGLQRRAAQCALPARGRANRGHLRGNATQCSRP